MTWTLMGITSRQADRLADSNSDLGTPRTEINQNGVQRISQTPRAYDLAVQWFRVANCGAQNVSRPDSWRAAPPSLANIA